MESPTIAELARLKGISEDEMRERLSPGPTPPPPKARLLATIWCGDDGPYRCYSAWGDTDAELQAEIDRIVKEHGIKNYWTDTYAYY